MGVVTSSGPRIDHAVVALVVGSMFPHPGFPAGPYQRTAAAIVEAAGAVPRLAAQLQQGLAELEAVEFAALDDHARLEYLHGISASDFFEAIRSHATPAFYGDIEVWQLLGYERTA
jgi:hypothetical protein